eukprot:scaffold1146_cov399-Prasinococcus_capsulatus_cf.AAC.72
MDGRWPWPTAPPGPKPNITDPTPDEPPGLTGSPLGGRSDWSLTGAPDNIWEEPGSVWVPPVDLLPPGPCPQRGEGSNPNDTPLGLPRQAEQGAALHHVAELATPREAPVACMVCGENHSHKSP